MNENLTELVGAGPWPGVLVGVLGGMGPEAGAGFLHELTAATPASRDQEHLAWIALSLPQLPDRTEALLHGGPSPAAGIRAGLEQLVAWGATLLAVPCNTAHPFIDEFVDQLPVPLVHIVAAVMDEASRVAPDGAWLTGTDGTLASGIYQREAERRGYRFHLPSADDRRRSMEIIGLVKAGRLEASGREYRELADSLWRRQEAPIITACTELPIAFDASGLPPSRQVSSLAALARATVRAAEAQRA